MKRQIASADVAAVFQSYSPRLRARLKALRALIFDTASATEGVGALHETLKWRQPSYLTAESNSGSTIRIDRVQSDAPQYALYFHCQTDLVETFRRLYPEQMRYEGNRSIVFDLDEEIPERELGHCIALALTYRLRKNKNRRRQG
jgi:hypothetical protein